METRKYSGLFNPGGCLTAETFRKYLENDLRPSEKVKVENHLRHCLICSEALEGYKRHRHNTIIKSDLDFLSGKIRKRYSSKKTDKGKLPIFILISLFVFLIILLIIFFIIHYLLGSSN